MSTLAPLLPHYCLVSGATSGIGRAVCERLLALNHRVIGLGRDHSKYSPDTSHYQNYGIDFNDLLATETLAKLLKKNHPEIDTIICSAGVGHFGSLEQLSLSQISASFHVNIISQMILIKALLPQLKQKKRGRIILIGSEAALSGEREGSAYCATKFALRGFSQSLRKECQNANVTVTLINPGFVNTPFFDKLSFAPADPHTHAIQPEHIANTISLVLSSSSHCNFDEINLQPTQKKVIKKGKISQIENG